MRDNQPYLPGELRVAEGEAVMIMGHIWWPVEQQNAYYCVVLDGYLEPTERCRYIWDTTKGQWPVVTPK